MADRTARPSTDEETAPLLDNSATGNGSSHPSFSDRISSVAQEPLTALTKILLILALVLLLISSVFIGLFAGAQHKLNAGHDAEGEKSTLTVTATSTSTSVAVSATTATATRTTTATSTATSTTVSTTTVIPIPIPVPTTVPEEKPCTEPHCVILAASILSSLDTSQDPCENFYEFANNGWLKAHPLPSDKASFGNFESLAQQNKQVIQEILDPQVTSAMSGTNQYDRDILKKLRDFYASCLNENQLDEIGTLPLLHLTRTIKRLYRGESAITSRPMGDETNIDVDKGLTTAIAFLHSRGIDSLFSFDIEGDVGVDPNHMVLWFSQSDFGLPSKEYYTEKSIIKEYKQVIERLLVILDEDDEDEDIKSSPPSFTNNQESNVWPPWPWPPWSGDDEGDDDDKKPVNKSQRIKELAKGIIKFESRIAEASLDLDLLQDPIASYNPTSLRNLTLALPQIHFPTYFSTFTPRSFPDRVIVTYPSYASSLSDILNSTSSEVIEGYLVIRTALKLSPYLGMATEAWQAQRSLWETLTGVKKGAVGDRAEYCVSQIENTLGLAVGRYFVNETFAGESKERGTKVITDIIQAFKASLSGIDWMDKQSAKAAAEKADSIRVKVGYPLSPNTLDPRSIAMYYQGVKVDKSTFFENMLSSAMNDEYKAWQQIGKQRDLESWEMYPSEVNAYFNPPSNEIVFPAGILQPPFFSQNWPGYLAYGAFGQVASHELTHAFDSSGRLYNQKGKLEEWWSNTTSQGFQVKQDCIIKQFSAYSIDDGKGGKIHVNGNLTSGENIGDSGFIQAYRAWKAQYHTSLKAGTEYLLPGLNFTREQLFFISFARIWARALKPAAAVQRIRTDPHSPSRYRVDGTVFNIPEFAKAFKCHKTAKLNPPPEKQCIFWS